MSSSKKKYFILAETLRNELKSSTWQPGQRFYTENQLCQMYDLSRQTVRQTINLLVEEKLLEKRRGSGTYVTEKNGDLLNVQSRTIGIIVTYLSDYIFPVIIKELEKVFTAAGYYVYIASTGNSVSKERKLLQAMLEKKVDGIIIEPTKSALPNPNLELYRELHDQNYPIICINSTYRGLSLPIVALDDKQAGYIATKHLINHGHTKLGAILKSDDIQGHLRYSGFQKAILEKHAEFMDDRVYWYTTEDLSYLEDDANHILNRLQGWTAVLCYNDQIALRLIAMLNVAGISVPTDVSVVSIDDSLFASLGSVPLTSVHTPAADIGRIAAENLLSLIAGQDIKAGRIFKPQLTERKSVLRLALQVRERVTTVNKKPLKIIIKEDSHES